ncbi:peptide deformylase [Candidatus Gracilibacteria bacterium]|nr:peptide deformylase [Candidatus Gracilibacteria bacterium]
MRIKIEIGKNNEILRTVSQEIRQDEIKKYSKIGEEMVKFIKNSSNGGVGLAAPQIGISKRLICVSLLKSYNDDNFKTIFMINPKIIEKGEKLCIDEEGCLSVPGEILKVERPDEIKLFFLDTKGKENILFLKGIASRIVQHEIDHLDGILFIDRIIKKGDLHKEHIL